MFLALGFETTASGLLTDEGVEVRVVLAFEAGAEGINGCAVMVAQVIAGVLELEVVPVGPFDSTLERAGNVAVTACKGPLGTTG